MIEQHQTKGASGARRWWKAAFALLLVTAIALSSAPELTASALYFISDGIGTVVSGGTESVDAGRIVMEDATIGEGDVTLTGGRKVVIRQNGGELYATSRTGETVSALLRREGVALSPLEMVFVDLSGENIVLEIASDFTYYETVAEAASFNTVYRTDFTLPKGTSVVTQAGEAGRRDVTYEVIYADGELVSRQSVTDSEYGVKDEIVSVGTLVTEAQPGDTIVSVITKEDGSGYLRLKSGDSLHFTGSMQVTCTAYSSEQSTVGTRTYTGTQVEVGVVAVDKKVIPLGTKMFITTNDGSFTYGMGRAEDTGVRGASVDLYMDTIYQCKQFGRRGSTVYFLDQ